jgi:hypothetical protein
MSCEMSILPLITIYVKEVIGATVVAVNNTFARTAKHDGNTGIHSLASSLGMAVPE